MATQRITSWEQLRERVSSILERVNADADLARAAAVNPLHALDELGYEIAPEARPEIEDRLRFRPRTAARRRQLRESVYERAGRRFDLSSPDDLRRVLFDELRIAPPGGKRQKRADPPETRAPRPRRPGEEEQPDPLERLKGADEIMPPLLEYRRLDASTPRLASRELYEQVRRGKRRLPIGRLTARLRESEGERAATAPTPRGGRLNVNRADADELELLPGISRAVAERIVERREEHGPFAAEAALRRVRGLGTKRVEAIRESISFED